MERQKILSLLNEANDSKFVTKELNIVNDQSNSNYSAVNEIIYNTEVLKPSLCDFSDYYILVRGGIIFIWPDIAIAVALKNCAPFINYITKVDGTTIDDAEDLDLVTPMYNLLENRSSYSVLLIHQLLYEFFSNMKQLILMSILLAILIFQV